MARTYGEANYDTGLYGVTTYIDAVIAGSAASASTADGVFLIDGSVNDIVGTSATASAAIEVYDGMAHFGASAVGTTATGYATRNASALSSPSATGSALLQFVTNAEASTSATSAVTSAGERIGACTYIAC
jgi:hypothetical protein